MGRAELDRGCVWVVTWEGKRDALRAMRVEHLQADPSRGPLMRLSWDQPTQNSLFLLSHLLAATNLALMNIPVTGGAGYIGSICTEALLAADL